MNNPVIDDYGEWWYDEHGLNHREDGPAVIGINGTKQWFLHGKRHREDGPAIEFEVGHKSWYLNGKRHREDGPAVIGINGVKYWYLHGEEIKVSSNEEFLRMLKLKSFW